MSSPEVEMKFLSAPGSLATVGKSPIFAGKSTRVQLKSVYFDTAGFDLRRHGLGLRVRHIEGAFIQTVKRQTGSGLFDRDEWESEIKGERPDPAAWAGTPVQRILGRHGLDKLAPLFSTTVHRTIRLWKEGTSLIEISLDQGELAAAERREPIEELELELKKGKVTDLFILARRLGTDAILRLSFTGKAERGYRLIDREGLTGQKANAIAIAGDMAPAEAFVLAARSCLTQVAANAELVSRDRSAGGLHQLRVGLRRLQAALTTFEPLFGRAPPERLQAEIKWLVKELNAARDLDVFLSDELACTAAAATQDRIMASFGARLLHAQSMAYTGAQAAVDSARFAALLLDSAEWAEVGSWASDADAASFATQALDRLRRQVMKKGKNPASLEVTDRHKLRIRAKNLRYAGEFFAATFGEKTLKRHRRFIASLKTLQTSLGRLTDLAAARACAATVAGDSAELSFRAGRVIGARERAEPELLAKAIRAYERWRRVRPFWR